MHALVDVTESTVAANQFADMLANELNYGQLTIDQIVSLYETVGLNEAMIAEALDIPGGAPAVKAILSANSSIYRQQEVAGNVMQLSAAEGLAAAEAERQAEYNRLKKRYQAIADDPKTPAIVAEKALRWLMDEAKGRNDLAAEALALKAANTKGRSDAEERLARFNAMIASGSVSVVANPIKVLPAIDVKEVKANG